MKDEDKDKALHCPTCAEVMEGAEDDFMICKAGHRFQMADFVSAQTDRIRNLIRSAIRMLDEQAAVLGVIQDVCETSGVGSPKQTIKLENAIVRTTMMANALEGMISAAPTSIDASIEEDDKLGNDP